MRGPAATLLALGLALLPSAPAAAQPAPVLVGEQWTHQVKPKEKLSTIARRYGLDPRRLRAINRLGPKERLVAGQRLHLSNRHIAPAPDGSTLVINVPELMLYRFDGARLVRRYPVALGEPRDPTFPADPRRWQSPLGTFTVAEKRANPVWNIPKSIQEEREAEGKKAMTRMPPGPENPLGRFWIGLSRWGYGIHGTIAPETVGRFETHGCIRMKPAHIKEVFGSVRVGDVVRLAYAPVKVLVAGQQVWLEVGRDPYGRIPDLGAHTRKRLAEAGVLGWVDPQRVAEVVAGRWGVAVRVDRAAPAPFPELAPGATPSSTPRAAPNPPAAI